MTSLTEAALMNPFTPTHWTARHRSANLPRADHRE